ncbi:hypothetical protein JCM6882_004873 [Rhodosporidiobolus microsporus]
MPPWQQNQLNNPPSPPAQLESDDDEQEDAPPPNEYFTSCRDLFPSSTRRDALRAWDRTKDIGAGGEAGGSSSSGGWDPNSARVQAALGALAELCTTSEEQGVLPRASSSSRRREHKRPHSPSPLPPDDNDEPELSVRRRPAREIDLSSSPPPPTKRARPSLDDEPAQKPRKEKGKGKVKWKSRAVDLVLGDSDDEDLESSIEMVSPRKRQGKGKGRAPAPSSDVDLIDLAASSDIELEPARASTSTAGQSRSGRSPSFPTPPPSPLSQILSIIPDVLPSHATALLDSEEGAGDPQRVIDLLLEAKEYPTIGGEEKKKKVEEKDWLDLAKRKREGEDPSPLYKRMALDNLYASFPLLPAPLIKSSFLSAGNGPAFFAPTYLALTAADSKGEYDARKLKKPRKAPKKVMHLVFKTRVNRHSGEEEAYETEEEEAPPEELQKEMDWVRNKILKERREARQAEREAAAAKAEEERVERLNERARKKGSAVECQCCFDEVAAANTASCDAGHLFCKTCSAANANHRLGDRHATLPCMAPDCKAFFAPRSWRDFLPQKTIDGLEKIAQESEVGKAFEGVEGFETCPFCPYACFIENPDERLFRCERADCRKVSCRKCRKEGHVPLTCEEADSERRLPGVHAVAESMTAALIRNCPKCKVATAKIDGCNHMTCQCGAHWCYICRALIKGYGHFNDRGGTGGCPTFDDTAMRNFNEVEEARRAAEAELDDRTRGDAAKLAAEAPARPAPRYPAPVAGVANAAHAGAAQAAQIAQIAAQAAADAMHAFHQQWGQRWQFQVPAAPHYPAQPQPQVFPGHYGWYHPAQYVAPAPAAMAQPQPVETEQQRRERAIQAALARQRGL